MSLKHMVGIAIAKKITEEATKDVLDFKDSLSSREDSYKKEKLKREKIQEKKRVQEILKSEGFNPIRANAVVERLEKAITGKTAEQKVRLMEYLKVRQSLLYANKEGQDSDTIKKLEDEVRFAENRFMGAGSRVNMKSEKMQKILEREEYKLIEKANKDLGIEAQEIFKD